MLGEKNLQVFDAKGVHQQNPGQARGAQHTADNQKIVFSDNPLSAGLQKSGLFVVLQ